MATASIVLKFLDAVVWGTIRMKEGLKVAHELLLLYLLHEIDLDAFGMMNMATVLRQGGQDTLLTEARRNVGAFFRPRVGAAPPDGGSSDEAR